MSIELPLTMILSILNLKLPVPSGQKEKAQLGPVSKWVLTSSRQARKRRWCRIRMREDGRACQHQIFTVGRQLKQLSCSIQCHARTNPIYSHPSHSLSSARNHKQIEIASITDKIYMSSFPSPSVKIYGQQMGVQYYTVCHPLFLQSNRFGAFTSTKPLHLTHSI